jgi:hypothetical protein
MKKQNKQGSAMIVVLCCMAILMVLVLGLLLTSSTLVANASRKRMQEQCRISASSFSKLIEKDLCDTAQTPASGSLRAYVNEQIDNYMQHGSGWAYYNEDEEEEEHQMLDAKRTFQFDTTDLEDKTGTIKLEGYWESDKNYFEIDVVFTVTATRGQETYKQRMNYTRKKSETGDWLSTWQKGEITSGNTIE